MRAEIYIELPASASETPRLAVWRDGRLQAAPEGFRPNGRPRTIAFAPALSVARRRVTVAAKSETEARKAALYAVEDDLAQSVEDVHMVLGARQPGAARDVYIADKGLMQHWAGALQALGLGHAEIVAEASLDLPFGTLLDFGDRLLMHGNKGILAADTAWPDDVIRELLKTSGLESAPRAPASALETLAALDSRVPGIRLTDARGANAEAQGGARRWLLAGAMAFAAAGLWFVSLQMESNSLQTIARQQEADVRALYRTQFTGAPEPADVHAEVRRLSAQSANGALGQFRTLSAALYEGLAAQPAAQLVSLSYHETETALRARILFNAAADAESLRAALEASGHRAATQSLTEREVGAEALLVIGAQP